MVNDNTLSEEQIRASHTPIGPTLIPAGPGSGKTRVVTERVHWMIRNMGIRPESILVFTFTNRAAAEIQERLKNRLGPDASGRLYAGTFHAWGARFLKQHGEKAGLSDAFTICDQEESVDLVREAMRKIRHPEESRPRIAQYLAQDISRWKSRRECPEHFLQRWQSRLSDPPEKMPKNALKALTYDEYQHMLRDKNLVDFDDLINLPLELLENEPELLAEVQQAVEHVIVDEYQDTSRNQHLLATTLANRPGDEFPSIFILGDTDQAIYAFRSADIKNLTRFQAEDYPNAIRLPLNDNYRSSPEIIDAAQTLIENNQDRISRASRHVRPAGEPLDWLEAKDPDDEAHQIAHAVRDSIRAGNPGHSHCIAYRTNPQSRPIEEALGRHDVPYVVVGNYEFYKRAEIRRYLDYLRLAVNRHNDKALERIINVPCRNVDQAALGELERYAEAEAVSLSTAVAELPEQGRACLSQGVHDGLVNLSRVIRRLNDMHRREASIAEFVEYLSNGVGLRRHFESLQDGAQRMPNVAELEQIAEHAFGQPLAEFMERTVVNHDPRIPQEQRVTVTTIHQTKGLEFPNVYVIGVEEGLLPHTRSTETPPEIEEERRLMYVAMTRAQDRLTVSWCNHRPGAGPNQAEFPQRSRFIDEIPDEHWARPLPGEDDLEYEGYGI